MKKEKIVDRSRAHINKRVRCLEFEISLELGIWDLELFTRKSLVLAMFADNCRYLPGEKKYFMPPSKIRPGAASKESPTRADFRRKHLIPRLSALIRALF
jgi:hypothetical protein